MKQNRRTFIRTASVSAAAFMTAMDTMATPATPVSSTAGFELLFMGTDWGFTGNRDQLCAAIKKEGYDGIEVWWPGDAKGQEELFAALKKHNLKVAFLCGGWQQDHKEHLETFRKTTTEAANNKWQQPLYINCHSGKDHFSMEENKPFIDHTTQLSKQSGVPIYSRTHRGRIMFAAHITRDYINKFPDLRLTFDVSHWCNVHESLLADQAATLELALQRVEHIHARIGHAEGPQVNDPRAPEWNDAVQQHLAWWDKVVARKKSKGERMTFLTEFGPPDYMPTVPYTRQALADQWGINVYMMKMLRERYK